MMRLWTVARNTFRESVRDKVLLTLLVVAFLVTAAARLMPSLAAGEGVKIIKDLGLRSMTLFSILIAILVGGRLVYKEIEKRTLFVILAKPLRRWEFLVGKYLGLMLLLIVSVAIMTAWFALFLAITRVRLDPRLLLPVAMLILKLGIITAVAVLFSTFVTPVSGTVFSLAVYFLGNLSRSLIYWGTQNRPLPIRGHIHRHLLPHPQPRRPRLQRRRHPAPVNQPCPGPPRRRLRPHLHHRRPHPRHHHLPAPKLPQLTVRCKPQTAKRVLGGLGGELILVLPFILAGLGVITIQRAYERSRILHEQLKAPDELMYFPSGPILGKIAGEYRDIIADYAWLLIAQYNGEHLGLARQQENYAWVGHAINAIGYLDPKFIEPYIFGAQLLAWNADRPADAIALLRNCIPHNQMNPELPFQAGFIAYEKGSRNAQPADTSQQIADSSPPIPNPKSKIPRPPTTNSPPTTSTSPPAFPKLAAPPVAWPLPPATKPATTNSPEKSGATSGIPPRFPDSKKSPSANSSSS